MSFVALKILRRPTGALAIGKYNFHRRTAHMIDRMEQLETCVDSL
jgi:hypothetical protein